VDLETRIKQFRTLLESDPDNDMAHFSLANALLQADRTHEAALSFIACTKINPGMTKAYQLAARALIDSGHSDDALEILHEGYIEATKRGDMLPKNAMAEMFGELRIEVPEVPTARTETPEPTAGDFKDRKTGRMGTQLPRRPFKGPVGEWIHENISKQTFDDWIGMGTKIINELRLDLSRDEHDAVYDYAMRVYLGLTDEIYADITGGKQPPMPDAQFKSVIDEIMARGGHLEDLQGQMHTRVED
jgi:Fe-S cluster biosynthesis and repair protein YggX